MLAGQNYTPLDLVAKVTGRAKYAEDYRADGMLFAKLLLSPMPHARVRRIDTRAALALPGVNAILTADDLPDLRGAERALTNEPLYQGEPILAVAAVDELAAVEAIERIDVDLAPLPFVVDPVESLKPNGPNGRLEGNVWLPAAPATPGAGGPPPRPRLQTLMQTEALGLADPETPIGARGVGEPPVGAGYGSVLNAIANAIGDEAFRRAPVTADIVLMSLEHGKRMHEPLAAHI